jgi:hypothetical protein
VQPHALKVKSCTRRKGRLTSHQQQQEHNEELGAGEMSKPRVQAAIRTQTRFQAASRPWQKLEPNRGPRRFQNTTLPCYNQQLRVSSPFTGRRASPGNQPQNRKGHGAPTRVHQGKVITEKTLLQYEERLADDKTVDCLEDIAIVASAI